MALQTLTIQVTSKNNQIMCPLLLQFTTLYAIKMIHIFTTSLNVN